MATKTKAAPKRATKPAKKPASKRTTKPVSKRNAKTTKRTTTKKVAPKRQSVPTNDRDGKVAEKATAKMRQHTRGDKRAPVSAPQVAMVRGVVGRASTATVAKRLGFKSAAELSKHAVGNLEHLPEGATAKLVEFYGQLPDAPGASKIRGRKLTAIIASL